MVAGRGWDGAGCVVAGRGWDAAGVVAGAWRVLSPAGCGVVPAGWRRAVSGRAVEAVSRRVLSAETTGAAGRRGSGTACAAESASR